VYGRNRGGRTGFAWSRRRGVLVLGAEPADVILGLLGGALGAEGYRASADFGVGEAASLRG